MNNLNIENIKSITLIFQYGKSFKINAKDFIKFNATLQKDLVEIDKTKYRKLKSGYFEIAKNSLVEVDIFNETASKEIGFFESLIGYPEITKLEIETFDNKLEKIIVPYEEFTGKAIGLKVCSSSEFKGDNICFFMGEDSKYKIIG